MNKILYILLVAITTISCGKNTSSTSNNNAASEEYKIHYAKGFNVLKTEDYTHITVSNPWDSTALLQSYILVDKVKSIPNNLPKGIIVRTPITQAAAISVIQCAILDELQSIDIITGVCEPQYMDLEYIQEGIKSKKITDLGMASNPSSEAIILLSPEVVFVDPVVGQSRTSIERTKIPIILTPDYTEPHPLGRAEWIRFYSLFVGQEPLADSLFDVTVKNYNEVKLAVEKIEKKPSVFLDTRYRDSWNTAGGKTYMATMLADAGANYIWADDESTVSMPLSFEAVLDKAGDADMWLIRYYSPENMTYQSLQKEYKPYSYFKAFKEKKIYGCNTMHQKFYEDLPIHPDYILKDMAYAFHPNLFPEYEAKYYSSLQD